MTTADSSPPPDLVIRIALLRGEDDHRELSPSVWRRFVCSSAVNLDAFQDKLLQPLMGWRRNYHTYYFFDGDETFYFQNKSSSADNHGMHGGYRAQGRRVDPTAYTLVDLLSKPADTCFYAYDLGDHWYHQLTVEKVIPQEEADGDVEHQILANSPWLWS